MPRFVVLEHDHPLLHWDLMLEQGEELWSWRLSVPLTANQPQAGERTPNHRKLYLDYEGPVSGNRGHVIRRESGSFSWRRQEPEHLEVDLDGQNLRGVLILVEEASCWRILLQT